MMRSLRDAAARIRREMRLYKLVWRHPRTPRTAKILIGGALAYAVSPVDLIPDFIPVIGRVDDAVIVTGLVKFAMKLIPKDVIEECRQLSEAG